jgi:hypothetical protein
LSYGTRALIAAAHRLNPLAEASSNVNQTEVASDGGCPDAKEAPGMEEGQPPHRPHDEGTTRTLDAIRSGANHLLIIARRRIAEALDALDEGSFGKALGKLNEAESSIAPLASAQTYIAIADGSRVVEAVQLEAGMVLKGVGPIEAVNTTMCSAQRCSGHVKVTVGEHELDFTGDQELYVEGVIEA